MCDGDLSPEPSLLTYTLYWRQLNVAIRIGCSLKQYKGNNEQSPEPLPVAWAMISIQNKPHKIVGHACLTH